MDEHSNEWIPWHWHPWQLVCQATRSHVPSCVSYFHIFQMSCMEFKKNLFLHIWKFGGQLHYIILFHESWWHWQDLLLDVLKLISFLVCICRWLHIKISFIFANTIGIILIEKHSNLFYAQRSYSTNDTSK